MNEFSTKINKFVFSVVKFCVIRLSEFHLWHVLEHDENRDAEFNLFEFGKIENFDVNR